jgi:D-alanyl-D-alanine carboxypeptidase/D-alanyl-D-alanine endopeptidase (penicillin-binding protein 7)
MFKQYLIALTFLVASSSFASDLSFHSAHALVMDETSGEVLFEKDATTAAPIASMTKLMTAMVVLDAHLSPDETIRIEKADYDTLKYTRSGVPLGTVLPRRTMIDIALMSSDNHAAAALARTYPGGREAFAAAAKRKIAELQLEDTVIEEPTGLSPHNHATAHDMAKIAKAAAGYPQIEAATSQRGAVVKVNGRARRFHNTNGLVGAPGWDIMLSKTGFTNEAGRCLTMRLEAAGRKIVVVLMGAMRSSARTLDALNIHKLLDAKPAAVAETHRAVQPRT